MKSELFAQRFTQRAFINLLVHGVVFTSVFWLAFSLRHDFQMDSEDWLIFWLTLPAVLFIKLPLFYSTGHCHRSWHYISFADLKALLSSSVIAAAALVTLDRLTVTYHHIENSVILLDFILTIIVLGALRGLVRFAREELSPWLHRRTRRKALIVGANQSGETLARHLLADPRLQYEVVGFLDEDTTRQGSTVGGIHVLGHPDAALHIANLTGADHILVISGILPGKRLRALRDGCTSQGLTLKVIPALDELLNSSSGYSLQIRDVDINDLLRREPVELNSDAISSLIEGRTILVTGAGGSIGSEICRQVLKFQPKLLVLVERSENSLFAIEQEFRALRPDALIEPCIADITDAARISQVFGTHRPEVVFHAAAHKHVPMMEYNPGEAIKNNVLGTKQLAQTADEYGVQEFVMISTDKAVNPTSIMGVSKHLAERFVHAFSEVATTKFVVVRFGNVLASNGSVVPIFQEQIRRGGPITVTHPDIERFFMTIPEASQLVLQAAAMGKGGEIFVLDMGEPVRIVDLANDLIQLSGLQPGDVEIQFTGLRPGEKLYEELYFEDEERQPTPHPKLFVAYHRPFRLDEVRRSIDELSRVMHESPLRLRRTIKQYVVEYLGLEPTTPSVIAEAEESDSHDASTNGSSASHDGNPTKPRGKRLAS